MSAPDLPTLMTIAGAAQARDQAQLEPLIAAIRNRHEPAIAGIIYYGSCFRRGDPSSGLVDFYVVVDDLRAAGLGAIAASACRLLPPNVYYLEAGDAGQRLACKYAVVTKAQLERGVARWFCPTLWGRLAQPVAIVHARNADTRNQLRAACGRAVITLLDRALPALDSGRASPARWFELALGLSFASELRVEPNQRTGDFIGDRADEYARRFRYATPWLERTAVPHTNGEFSFLPGRLETRLARIRWRIRGWHGRMLSILRLAKACFTFDGAVDYGAWKVERHTGYRPQITARVRRHPLIFGWPLLVRALRASRHE